MGCGGWSEGAKGQGILRPLRWGNLCHVGCARGTEQRAHSWEVVHWALVAQISLRGGLESGPRVDSKAGDGRPAQFRTRAEAARKESIARGVSAKAGRAPPEEYTAPPIIWRP